MTDDGGNMSFSDPQLEFFNFDALSDDEVQRIKNVLKQPCSAVELPIVSVCNAFKDQANGVQGDYKSVPVAINMDYNPQVASTYASIPQPHIYSVASTVNGQTYITGYAVPGANVYLASTNSRKDYIPKVINGIDGMENGGGGNIGETIVDPNGVAGMVVSSNIYPAPHHWTSVYPCPTYVLNTMPTFFTPIAPVHAPGMRAATTTVPLCGENVIPSTVAPPGAYVTVAPVAIPPPVVADTSLLQQPVNQPEIPAPVVINDEEAFVTCDVYYEDPAVSFDNGTVEESISYEVEVEKSNTEGEIVSPTNDLATEEVQENTESKEPVTVANSVNSTNSNKTWASLFKNKTISSASASSLQTSLVAPPNQLSTPTNVPPTVASTDAIMDKNIPPSVDRNAASMVKSTKNPIENPIPEKASSNDYSHSNGLVKDVDDNDRTLGELLLNMKVDQRPVNFYPRGLYNKGNWCYINATLQALLACPPFYNFLSKLPNVIGLQSEKRKSPVSDCMVEFVHEFSPLTYTGGVTTINRKKDEQLSVTIGHPFEPIYIYNVMSKVKSDSFEGRQEDAEEFLSCLLNGLHDEMLAALSCVENGEKSNGNVVEHSEDDDETWKVIEKGNKCSVTRSTIFSSSPVSDIFCGRIRSALHAGSTSSVTLQPFFTLQLDIQSENVRSVKEALQGLVIKENLQGYYCSKTKQEVAASRQITLEELPPILILHLKRFVYDKDGGCQKLSKKLDFKIMLEIGKDLLSNVAKSKLGSNKQKLYKLVAVVYHCGREAIKGHYVTDVYHHGSNSWLRTDDIRLTVVQESEVLNHPVNLIPYIFFYRRLDDSPTAVVGNVK